MSHTYNEIQLTNDFNDIFSGNYKEEKFMNPENNSNDYNNLRFKIHDLIGFYDNKELNFMELNLEDQNTLCGLYLKYKDLDLGEMLLDTHLDKIIIGEIIKEYCTDKSDLTVWIKSSIKSSIKNDIQNIINDEYESYIIDYNDIPF
jgi:hypothetical protein